eukprot:scaffold22132_cov119-Isochrysis_galbana.AAC.4
MYSGTTYSELTSSLGAAGRWRVGLHNARVLGRQSLVMVRRCRVVSRRSRRRGSRQYTVADSRQLSGSGLRS